MSPGTPEHPSDADLHINVSVLLPNGDTDTVQAYLDSQRPTPLNSVAKTVSAAFAELDPEHLIAAGAPADEYDPEARHLVALHDEGVCVDTNVVQRVWEYYFGSQGSRDWQRLADAANDAIRSNA